MLNLKISLWVRFRFERASGFWQNVSVYDLSAQAFCARKNSLKQSNMHETDKNKFYN